ncbi:type II toxin-antitoxin system death-on-curing family toxin [Rossellomorea vietnamensis]|uniref:Type II toxin-antitoxin system death-on-curing family toxin n=1 Tax=Rossellomorea vietnamensis TaxID=218284 RepID=A0A5D4NUH5_9BACI|nr:type II toxin-antitoxin system death-on-curing family toxin [Rossellomorea vietnamensis]TYS17975.1 type II toxin-antitoxin system death-on-curing family toxin [Rossellomorea vietnamensis]
MTIYLTEHGVFFLITHQINVYSPLEQRGIKFPHLLNSGVNRPKQSAFGEDAYPAIFHKAAALYESLAKNHAFNSANKRTAFASLYMFLRQNGYKLIVTPQEAEDFTVLMEEKKNPSIPFEDIVGWIEDNSILSS